MFPREPFCFRSSGRGFLSNHSTIATILPIYRCTMVQNNQQSKRKYWVTRSSVHSHCLVLTHLLTPHCLLCACDPLRLFVRLFVRPLARSLSLDVSKLLDFVPQCAVAKSVVSLATILPLSRSLSFP